MRASAHRVGLLMLLAIGVLTARAASAAEPPTVPFATVAAGQRSAIATPLQVVVRDQAAWTALWRRHTGDGDVSIAPPVIDFQTSMVLAIFAGRAPHSTVASIVRILSEPERLLVQYRVGERRPITDLGQEVTPFHIARIPRSERPVYFVRVKTPPVLRPGPTS